MCEPTSIIMVASAVVGQFAKNQAAKKQSAALGENRKVQNKEIAAQAGRAQGERVKQGRAERARLRVAAGEAGVAGQSYAVTMMDAAFQEDEDVAMIGENAQRKQDAADAGMAMQFARIDNPSALESGLVVAGAGAKAWGAHKARELEIENNSVIIGKGRKS